MFGEKYVQGQQLCSEILSIPIIVSKALKGAIIQKSKVQCTKVATPVVILLTIPILLHQMYLSSINVPSMKHKEKLI